MNIVLVMDTNHENRSIKSSASPVDPIFPAINLQLTPRSPRLPRSSQGTTLIAHHNIQDGPIDVCSSRQYEKHLALARGNVQTRFDYSYIE